MSRTPVTQDSADQKPVVDPAAVLVETIRRFGELEEDDRDRVYYALGAYLGINSNTNQTIADSLELLTEQARLLTAQRR